MLLENNQDIQQLKLADFGSATNFSDPSNPELTRITGTEIYMAPEVLMREDGARPYTQKVDIWSCGIILYKLLVNRHPFDDQDAQALRQKVMIGDIEKGFGSTDWLRISPAAKAFVSKLLTKEEGKRPTAAEAVNDEWIKQNFSFSIVEKDDDNNELIRGSLKNLLSFQANTLEKVTVYNFFQQELSTKAEMRMMTNIFKLLDEDGDGELILAELQASYNNEHYKIDNVEKEAFSKNGQKILNMINFGRADSKHNAERLTFS